MNKNYVYIGLLAASGLLVSFSGKESVQKIKNFSKNYHLLNAAGSPGNYTGAPGEQTCASCHGGSAQSGASMNVVTMMDGTSSVTEYTPNTTYNMVITMNTNNARNGFQIVPLSPSNTMAGTITISDATHTKSVTSGGKVRVTHKSAGTSLSTWTFQWKAPATNVGTVTFYLATNVTNNNGTDGAGDVVYISQHPFGSQAGIEEVKNKVETSIGYQASNNSLNIQLNSKVDGSVFVNVVDLNGKSVFAENLGTVSAGESSLAVRLDNELNSGIYMVNVSVDNNMTMKKVFISK